MMNLVEPVRWADVQGRPSWRWGQVTGLDPLRVSFAGPLDPAATGDEFELEQAGFEASTTVAGLAVGDRVWCQRCDGELVVLGKAVS